ncbi:hypothetical protein CS022_18130 [Veronia nyctiphanis]|uniref:EVE domain-containing protein n=1 Tax=Veronia nyctiphanis TaxID=1278244 RepID=A0A4Q0YNJ6_9GAMM|nr:EVE domain-containing protein [Veronia nyctiphanis]RXJ72033.1 hypothetical protein CS022_18035 [Veronia nyctiphanis]RXJ72048.1 hypothetical protein CS022_18130 [Veronia nyctiphanis]
MSYWIFRGNREDFDIDKYLSGFRYVYWAVKHPKHQDEIKVGDKVFFWRSKGKSSDPYGLVAFGTVEENPVHKDKVLHPENLLEKYWSKREVSEIKVGVKLDDVRLSVKQGLVESTLLEREPILEKMQLLTARQGTNFRISSEQFSKVMSLWGGGSEPLELAEYSSDETRKAVRTHIVRERDPVLVKQAKAKFIETHGELFCEACGFKFSELYGFDYAEAHHKVPLSKLRAGKKTKITDLAILCANCHVAVHRIESADPMETLMKLHASVV